MNEEVRELKQIQNFMHNLMESNLEIRNLLKEIKMLLKEVNHGLQSNRNDKLRNNTE